MSASYIPLYIGDYLADTRHLSTEQHGAYILLLMCAWRCEGYLPNDEKKLARYAGLSVKKWQSISSDILDFFEVESDKIYQKRLLQEYIKYAKKVEVNSKNGSLGGRKKTEDNSDKLLKNNNNDKANGINSLKQPEPEPNIIDKSIIKEKIKKENYDSDFQEFWQAYPNKVGKPVSKTSFVKARKQFSQDEIMSGLSRYIESKPPDRAWCNPATFLNQERFNDEPSNPIQTTSNNSTNNYGAARQKPRSALDSLVERAFELNRSRSDDDFECDNPDLRVIASS